jgi:hypothetical protein
MSEDFLTLLTDVWFTCFGRALKHVKAFVHCLYPQSFSPVGDFSCHLGVLKHVKAFTHFLSQQCLSPVCGLLCTQSMKNNEGFSHCLHQYIFVSSKLFYVVKGP